MASAQVKKQGHLEAGKKRLEEFRKKKAAKKAALAEQVVPATTDPKEKSPQNTKSNNLADGPTSDSDSSIARTTSVPAGIYQNGPIRSSQSMESPSNGPPTAMESPSISNHVLHSSLPQESVKDEGSKLYGSSSYSNLANGYHDSLGGNDVRYGEEYSFSRADSVENDQRLTSKLSTYGNIRPSGFRSSSEVLLSGTRVSSATHARDSELSRSHFVGNLLEKSESTHEQDFSNNGGTFAQKYGFQDSPPLEHLKHGSSLDYGSIKGGERISDVVDNHQNVGSVPWQSSSGSLSTNFDMASDSFSKQVPFPSTSYPSTYGRSRPSFLDSLGLQRVPSTSQIPYEEPVKDDPTLTLDNSKSESAFSRQQHQPSAGSNGVEHPLKSGTQDFNHEKESFASTSNPLNNEQRLKHGNETYHNFTYHAKDDDFTALEQLIEDLTKEKFSLQRALETSQALAETLAADNSALTDNYNQQGQVISQLKSDMERLQEEIKAQLLALESVKMEYANAQLECNAADERAKVLAAEVITLEDKALRLRSNELKLEKEVRDLNSEISSYRRKVSSLEKERQDFQSTIDALQEERKLLHSKVRNLSATEKVNITAKPSADKRDAATATEDLDAGENSFPETTPSTTAINALEDAGPSVSLSDNTSSILLEEVPCGIPQDQLRMIDNINSLMSELAVEREELMRALRIESSNCSKLKELNTDLTQKLEVQTQRLELLTAQRMANENVLARPIDTHSINDATMYADEGDEVVERVLGWIMKLFPGGPKRRTSKLL